MTKTLPKISQTMIFSIPIDNVTLNSAVQRILSMVKDYHLDQRARQVVTVNVDFLINALSWSINGPARHPELLDILRNADLVTADGMPIVWLSHLLKSPLQERVTGADLVPALVKVASEKGHSIFFLGGKGDIGKQAAEILKSSYPKLTIAGVYSPFVFTKGSKMLTTQQQDNDIIRIINEAKPDILLIGFGNPKQELWFNRNRYKLKVPVSIGIGGTYEFIVGRVDRAPIWLQKMGFEWIYRIMQDPKKLYKRYIIGIVKLAVLTIPLLFKFKLSNLMQKIRLFLKQKSSKQKQQKKMQIKADHKNNKVSITLSKSMKLNSLNELTIFQNNSLKYFKMNSYKKIEFNFKAVETIDFASFSVFIKLLKKFESDNIETSIINLVNQDVIKLIKLSHAWDLINEKLEVKNEIKKAFKEPIDQYGIISINKQSTLLTVAEIDGKLDAHYIDSVDLDKVMPLFGQRDCILDLSKLSLLDSSGLRFFFKLQRYLKAYAKKLILVKPTQTVKQLFEITALSDFFNIDNKELLKLYHYSDQL
ncbi:MAG: WecB/TagA/CpsF family glycosyltransferase [Pseudomonadota bacterium]